MSSNLPVITVAQAIREAGSLSALARRLGVTRAAIYQWRHAHGQLPELYRYRFLYAHKKAPRIASTVASGGARTGKDRDDTRRPG